LKKLGLDIVVGIWLGVVWFELEGSGSGETFFGGKGN
jgi:hypothetical protein